MSISTQKRLNEMGISVLRLMFRNLNEIEPLPLINDYCYAFVFRNKQFVAAVKIESNATYYELVLGMGGESTVILRANQSTIDVDEMFKAVLNRIRDHRDEGKLKVIADLLQELLKGSVND